jgi:F0F1-type ATP synthase assembly protein I
MNTTPPTPRRSPLDSPWGAVSLVFELGYIIALPAILLGFGGAYLDKQMETSPLLIFSGLLLAFVISSLVIIGKVRSITQN